MNKSSPKTIFQWLPITFAVVISLLAEGILWQAKALGEEQPGRLIETFTLNRNNPVREFMEGRLKIELVSVTSDDLIKTISVRISSRSLKAEYGQEWQEHRYLEMLRYYVGSPISGSPFKCVEGWLYYEKSDNESVTISLRANPEMDSSWWYAVTVGMLENWRYAVIAFCVIGLVIFIYYYIPLLASFISIQHHARVHAMETGFPSSPVPIYLLKRLLLFAVFALFFIVSLPTTGRAWPLPPSLPLDCSFFSTGTTSNSL